MKMAELNGEIARLEDVYERGERDRNEIAAYERKFVVFDTIVLAVNIYKSRKDMVYLFCELFYCAVCSRINPCLFEFKMLFTFTQKN